jgi:hypothetical protein
MQRPLDAGKGRYADNDRLRYDDPAYSRQAAMAAMMASQKKPDPRAVDPEFDGRRAGPAGSAMWDAMQAHGGMRHPPAYGYGAAQMQEQYLREAMNLRAPHHPAGYEARGYPPQIDWNMRGGGGDWRDDYDQFASNGKGPPHQRHGKAGGKMT